MKVEFQELENILNKQIEIYEGIEAFMLAKKECLIKGNMEELKKVDIEIEKLSIVINKIEEKRKEINKKFGNENISLKEVLEKMENVDQIQCISLLGKKLKEKILKIQTLNSINKNLIEHGLKMVEHSISLIANALVPESVSYGSTGKLINKTSEISSVQHEA